MSIKEFSAECAAIKNVATDGVKILASITECISKYLTDYFIVEAGQGANIIVRFNGIQICYCVELFWKPGEIKGQSIKATQFWIENDVKTEKEICKWSYGSGIVYIGNNGKVNYSDAGPDIIAETFTQIFKQHTLPTFLTLNP